MTDIKKLEEQVEKIMARGEAYTRGQLRLALYNADYWKAEYERVKEQGDTLQKEVVRLKRKITTLMDAAIEVEDNPNHFDQREHYREM